MKTIADYVIVDHGLDAIPQYFNLRSMGRAAGRGKSYAEALIDAMRILARWGWDTAKHPRRPHDRRHRRRRGPDRSGPSSAGHFPDPPPSA